MRVTYEDIRKRINGLSRIQRPNMLQMREAQIYTDHGVFCESNAVESIEHWESLAETTDASYEKALNIFEGICENSNISTIKSSADVLIEG